LERFDLATRWLSRKEALEKINVLLRDAEERVDLIIVEGVRDVEALRALRYENRIEIRGHIGASDHDLAHRIARKGKKVLVLMDFDEKGTKIAERISFLLESEGVIVERELRRKFNQMMGVLGVKTIESLDDLVEKEYSEKSDNIFDKP